MKDFDVGHHAKDTCLANILAELLLECVHHPLVLGGQGFVIVVGWIHLIIRQCVEQIDGIEPTLRFEDRVPIVSVVVQQGLDVRFVMVRVRLRTDERAIESDADLLEEGAMLLTK